MLGEKEQPLFSDAAYAKQKIVGLSFRLDIEETGSPDSHDWSECTVCSIWRMLDAGTLVGQVGIQRSGNIIVR
jgi:hypothetical protein